MKILKLLFLLLVLSYTNTTAGEKIDTVRTDEVVVTANKVTQLNSKIARIISIINPSQLKNSSISSISDALELDPAIDVRNRGIDGIQSDISIRGGTFEQALILLNGIPMNDPQTGHHSMNLPLDISDVNSIEVLHGPGSRVLGPNSFSGAINIITNNTDKTISKFSLDGGEYGYYKMAISQSFTINKFSTELSYSRNRCDGYVNNTDYDVSSLFLNSKFQDGTFQVSFQSGMNKKDFGANNFYTARFPNQFEKTSTYFGSLSLSGGEKLRFNANAYYRKHYDEFQLFRSNPATWYKNHNYHSTDVFGTQVGTSYQMENNIISLGIELRNEEIISNVLGNELDSPIEIDDADGLFYHKGDDRLNLQAYGEQVWSFDQFKLAYGMMLHHNERYGTYYNPGLDLSYLLNDNLNLFTSFNKSMRLPSFTDLYYSGPTNIGNPDLKPETAYTIELGTKYYVDQFSIQGSIYRRFGIDIIDWVKESPEDEKWQPRNHTEFITNGLELSAKYLFNKSNSLKSISLAYAFTDLDKNSEDFASNYYLDFVKHKLALNIQSDLFLGIKGSTDLIFQDRYGQFESYDITTNTSEFKEYDPFFIINLKIKKDLEFSGVAMDLYLSINNLLNTTYRDFSNLNMPGRWVRMGISMNTEW